MPIYISDIGFCFGVENAIAVLRKAHEERGGVLLTHPLLHNKAENDDLLLQNDATIGTDSSDASGKAVVFSAHGHDPMEESRFPGAHLYDATCPLILKRYQILRQKEREGVPLLFLGKKGHQETVGFLSHFPSMGFVDAYRDIGGQLDALRLERPVYLVPQTTLSKGALEETRTLLADRGLLAGFLPLCPLYEKRSNDVLSFFDGKDPKKYYLVVSGDPSSSNANEILNAALSKVEGLEGQIAMTGADIDRKKSEGKTFALCSSTSVSKENVRRLMADLEVLEKGL